MLTLDTVLKDTIWVAKMNGFRETGTYDEIKAIADNDDCREMDICCEQPAHLKDFYNQYFNYSDEHGFITVQDYFNAVYARTIHKRVWSSDEIKELIQTNDKVLYRALIKLYNCQTKGEQFSKETVEANGAGFNMIDSAFLTSVSEFLLKRGYLTDKQKVAVRKKIVKYTKQLTRLANA